MKNKKREKEFLSKILESEDVVQSINDNLKELLSIIPELQYMIGFEHKHPHHHLDVWNHTLLALSKSENNFIIRLALLLHDVGKPFSFQDVEVRHFKGHAEVSSKIAFTILERLNYNQQFIEYICKLIANHDTPITDEQIESDRNYCTTLYKVQYCDALAHHPDKLEKRISYLKNMQPKIFSGTSQKVFVKNNN